MVGWDYQLNGHEFEPTSRDNEGQGSRCAAVHGVKKAGYDLETEQWSHSCYL